MVTGARTGTITLISMGLITAMDNAAVLTLAQWFSPGFPIGAFSYSHGLETAIAEGQVTDAAGVQAWVTDVLRYGAGRNDAILLAAAYGADDATIVEIDVLARALAPSRERLLEASQQGAAFASTVQAVWGHDVPETMQPVAVGAAAARENLPLALTVETYLHSFAANLVSAAVRLIPLGQTEGQAVLLSLKSVVAQAADESVGHSIDDLGACCFAADIAAMRHETQYTRIFRS